MQTFLRTGEHNTEWKKDQSLMESTAPFKPRNLSGSTASSADLNEKPAPNLPYDVVAALERTGLDVDPFGRVILPPSSATHPRQWHIHRKVYDTAVICLLEFITTVTSNSGSTISQQVGDDVGISRELALFILTSLYLIGQGLGGLCFPPISEVFGGRIIYVVSSAIYAAMCLMIGLAPSVATIAVGRFVTGVLSAMPTVAATGSIENIWGSRSRIWALSTWAFIGTVALAVGPVYATYASDAQNWHWVFIGAAIAMGVGTVLSLGMRESRPSRVLHSQIQAVAKETGFDELKAHDSAMMPTASDFLQITLLRPMRLFLTEPIVCLISIMGGTVVSLFYLFAEALPVVFRDHFFFTADHGSLVFLIFGAGMTLLFLSRAHDVHQVTRKRSRPYEPEDQLFGFLIAAPALAIGLWWFGASVPPFVNISPAVAMVALAPIGFAVVEFDYVLSGYLTEVYASYAASANASLCVLRAVVGAVYPLFGRRMFSVLGPNVATFIIAALATVYCIIGGVFWRYGKVIRQRSSYAEKNVSDVGT